MSHKDPCGKAWSPVQGTVDQSGLILTPGTFRLFPGHGVYKVTRVAPKES